jgi:hypothetical protein
VETCLSGRALAYYAQSPETLPKRILLLGKEEKEYNSNNKNKERTIKYI